MKRTLYYTLFSGLTFFSPCKLLSNTPSILVGARGSAMFLILSYHYDVYAGFRFNNSPEYEARIAYGESYFADWSFDEWRGNFWYLDGSIGWKIKETYSDLFRSFIKDYTKIGIFYIIKSKYYKLATPGEKPFQLGGYFVKSSEVKNLSFDIYVSIGGASMIGVGYGITYYIH